MSAKKTEMKARKVEETLEEDQAEDWEKGDAEAEDLVDLEDVDIEDIDGTGEGEENDEEPSPSQNGEALDELEAEELEMLTEDEASEVIQVDEEAEIRALRREQMALEVDPEEASGDEFVCQSCFLVKRISQLSDRRRRLCNDCVAA